MKFVLSVKNLRKVYPGKVPFVAVDGLSFDLAPGEILGLLGSNGAGKTTTIQMLLSTLSYTSGEILYFGKELKKHRSEVLQHVAFASTYMSLPWKLTVGQNLRVFGYLYGLSREEMDKKIDPLLDRFGILALKKKMVSDLSAGQITRLILVKAFLGNPKVVLLDEPTASLDPDIAHEVCEFLLQERDTKGLSILFTSHKMDEVSKLCDRVLFIQKGKIIADDIPENLARSVSSSRLQLVLSDGMKRTTALADKMGMTYRVDHRQIELHVDEKEIAAFLTALARIDVTYSHIKVLEPTLEDYFLKMVKNK